MTNLIRKVIERGHLRIFLILGATVMVLAPQARGVRWESKSEGGVPNEPRAAQLPWMNEDGEINKKAFRTFQSDDFLPGEIYVRFLTDVSQSIESMRDIHDRAGALHVIWESRFVPGLVKVQVPAGEEEQVANLYLDEEGVEYAEPNYTYYPHVTPNDPFYPQMWGLENVNAPQAWDYDTGQSNLRVGVVDTGTYFTHPDLAGNLWNNTGEVINGVDDDGNGYIDDVRGWNVRSDNNNIWPDTTCSDDSHGTHVAGTIGAVSNNGMGVAGLMWDVSIVTVNAGVRNPNTGRCGINDTPDALEYVLTTGCFVSNHSYGGSNYSQSMYDMIDTAKGSGHIFVSSAGNGGGDNVGDNNDILPQYPASYDLSNIISVAAIDVNDDRAEFSNYGLNSVDIGAPGVGICSTIDTNSYSCGWDGTSMASPHVAGAIALMRAAHPGDSWQMRRDRIFVGARTIADLNGLVKTNGTLDVAEAISYQMYASDLWVDFNFLLNGIGTYTFPFNDLNTALNAAPAGEIISIKPGQDNWTGVINQNVVLNAPYGGVSIGN